MGLKLKKNKLVYNYFDDDDFLRITKKIKEIELKTSGELRVVFRESRSALQKKKSIEELAQIEFYNLKMNNTRDKTGILFYFLLSERLFYIYADSGIHSMVNQDTWDNIRDKIQIGFKEGRYLEAVLSGLDDAGDVLAKHFPRKAEDTDELSNKVEF
jgi:uncharacterized membrane protein